MFYADCYTDMSKTQADQPSRILRQVVRFLRWAVDDSAAYEVARRLWREIQLYLIVRRLAVSSTLGHRQVASRLASVFDCDDEHPAAAIDALARRKPDTRAEKIVSHRYKFVWICNPKVASRSIIGALLAADPEAILVKQRTMDELFSEYPESRQFFSFAFVRDPCERARSFFEDKLDRGPLAPKWTVNPWFHGLRKGIAFADYCRWLDTPFGSDAYADRHWLSQYKHLEVDGVLPDYVGSYGNLDEHWQRILERLGVPHVELPHLNKRRDQAVQIDQVDADSVEILHRRYARDFDLLRRVGSDGLIGGDGRQ